MALRKRSRWRQPQPSRLIYWTLALVASKRAFVTFVSTASMRIAYPYHRRHIRSAQPRDCCSHGRIVSSLIAHARATHGELKRGGVNARRCRCVMFPRRVGQSRRLFPSQPPPCCRRAQFSDRRT